MGVFKINKTSDYTVMSNTHLRDKDLSLKAKGLLSVMLSLPDDWDYSVPGLTYIANVSKGTMQALLKELQTNGYLVRKRRNGDGGKFDYIYDIYEQPQHKTPCTENPCMVNPCTDNYAANKDTNILNTDISNTDVMTTTAREKFKTIFDKYYFECPDLCDKDSRRGTKLKCVDEFVLYDVVAEDALERYFIKVQNYDCKDKFETIIKWATADGTLKQTIGFGK